MAGVNFPKDLATFLDTNIATLRLVSTSAVSVSPNNNLFYNVRMLDNDSLPSNIVCIFSTKPRRASRSFSGCKELRYKRATILVRGDINGSNEDIEDLCETIYETLQSANLGSYKDVVFRDGFEQMTIDEQSRYIWVADIDAWYERT